MTYHSSVPEKANAYRKKIVKTFEAVKTAHKNNTDKNKKTFMSKIMSKRQPENQEAFDVRAWREAKLEEYRLQKILARKY